MRILFVDDDRDILSFVQDKVTSLGDGTVAETALGGYEAMGLLKNNKYDLVCTDYNMKDGDGGSLANYCRDHGIEFVVLTGYEAEFVAPYLPRGSRVFNKLRFFMGHSCRPDENYLQPVLDADKSAGLQAFQCRVCTAGGCANDTRRKAG